MRYDVVVVGGGPAGLSAALILGRCRRSVLLCDTGKPRNRWAPAMHGYLSRDGINPLELLKIGREQLKPYQSVEVREVEVLNASCEDDIFNIVLASGATVQSRKLLLATGVRDQLPDVEGVEELYGRGVVHCPYCDGWERRDQPLAVYGSGKSGRGLALTLTVWTDDIALCTDGPCKLTVAEQQDLAQRGIRIFEQKIARLEGTEGQLQRIVFADGSSLARHSLFVHTVQVQGSSLPERLGCENKERRSVETGDFESTHIPGLFVAGDASRDTQLVIVAAAEGANAAFAINKELLTEDLKASARDSGSSAS